MMSIHPFILALFVLYFVDVLNSSPLVEWDEEPVRSVEEDLDGELHDRLETIQGELEELARLLVSSNYSESLFNNRHYDYDHHDYDHHDYDDHDDYEEEITVDIIENPHLHLVARDGNVIQNHPASSNQSQLLSGTDDRIETPGDIGDLDSSLGIAGSNGRRKAGSGKFNAKKSKKNVGKKQKKQAKKEQKGLSSVSKNPNKKKKKAVKKAEKKKVKKVQKGLSSGKKQAKKGNKKTVKKTQKKNKVQKGLSSGNSKKENYGLKKNEIKKLCADQQKRTNSGPDTRSVTSGSIIDPASLQAQITGLAEAFKSLQSAIAQQAQEKSAMSRITQEIKQSGNKENGPSSKVLEVDDRTSDSKGPLDSVIEAAVAAQGGAASALRGILPSGGQ